MKIKVVMLVSIICTVDMIGDFVDCLFTDF